MTSFGIEFQAEEEAKENNNNNNNNNNNGYFKCYFYGEHIALSIKIKKIKNGVNIEL